ncbi:uncharacterized protein EV420DRAFT_1484617 [Desarmillaria tabescens]|uniref:F-box domain-containing protein n=1 Tax=Armillaria tabescens TaxID=1929756 RepID=A0AA39JL61_ARMTA|nr:uncharacterized protein EV420DRAFT_1484617 [Desarmillaria tabescens]KAK0444653.1 hypothetical protein EV420DRAFT_1484617 [Desarmillaria tabescens]
MSSLFHIGEQQKENSHSICDADPFTFFFPVETKVKRLSPIGQAVTRHMFPSHDVHAVGHVQIDINLMLSHHKCCFQALPADILREIFLLVSSNAADVTQFPWTAAHICAEWRTIAMHTPILWSKIHVITTLPSRVLPCDMGEMAKLECLPSKEIEQLPRKFQMLELLMDHAPRWKVAYLSSGQEDVSLGNGLHRLRGRILNLECLSIDVGTFPMEFPFLKKNFSITSRLFKLAIRNNYDEEVVFPWQQIKRLVFNGFHDLPYILRALRSAQNVEHLTFSPNALRALDLNAVPIALPTIRCLDIDYDQINPPSLLSRIILPGLQKLFIDHDGLVEQGNLISLDFMTKNFVPFETVAYQEWHATFVPLVQFGPAFKDVIALWPTLMYLDVGFVPPIENIDLVFSFMIQRIVIPALRSLRITFRVCNIWEGSPRIGEQLVEVAMMRRNSLRVFEASVYVEKSQGGTAILSSADKASLEALKANGMSIKVR